MEATEMENKISEHDEVIQENILPRLKAVEKIQTDFSREVNMLKNDLLKVEKGQVSLEKGQKDLELTLVKEGEANRKIMNENKDLSNKLLDHVLKKDKQEAKNEAETKKNKEENAAKLKSQKWEIIGKVSVVLAGTGSVIYAAIQLLIQGGN